MAAAAVTVETIVRRVIAGKLTEDMTLEIFLRIRHRRLANRAFAVAAPSSWNCLPDNIRNCQSYNNFDL